MHFTQPVVTSSLALSFLLVGAACGDDAAVPGPIDAAPEEGGTPDATLPDASPDASVDATVDGSIDASLDAIDDAMVEPPCGDDEENLDGTCTRLIAAGTLTSESGYMQKGSDACPVSGPVGGPWDATAWTIEAYRFRAGTEYYRRHGYLSFDTSGLPAAASVERASVRLFHAREVGVQSNVELFGGAQPIFGDGLDEGDWEAGDMSFGQIAMADIVSAGHATWDVGAGQVNATGVSSFTVRLVRDCADFAETEGNNFWGMASPTAEDERRRPLLRVVYTP